MGSNLHIAKVHTAVETATNTPVSIKSDDLTLFAHPPTMFYYLHDEYILITGSLYR